VLTIDRECDGWQCDVGMVPTVLEHMKPDPANTIAITCGPPIMIKFAVIARERLGYTSEHACSALEMIWAASNCLAGSRLSTGSGILPE
jgi:sulfhydrogenase subunit gamma (sulfur reductase)